MSSIALVQSSSSTRASTTADANSVAMRDANGGLANNQETVTQLTVNGAIALKFNPQTASYAMQSPGGTGGGDVIVEIDCTGGARNVTLPSPSSVGAGNMVVVIKKDNVNNATILPNGAETINGASSKVLSTQYSVCRLISNGTNWYASTTTS